MKEKNTMKQLYIYIIIHILLVCLGCQLQKDNHEIVEQRNVNTHKQQNSELYKNTSHIDEYKYVFCGLEGDTFDDLLKSITREIDLEFYKILKDYKSINRNQKMTEYWGILDGIPFDEELSNVVLIQYDNKEIIREWKLFINKLIKISTEKIDLPENATEGITGLIYDIYLLSERKTGKLTKRSRYESDLICIDIENNLRKLFGHRSDCVKLYEKEIKIIPQDLSTEYRANEIQRILGNCSIGKSLVSKYGKNLATKRITFCETLETNLIEKSYSLIDKKQQEIGYYKDQVKLGDYIEEHMSLHKKSNSFIESVNRTRAIQKIGQKSVKDFKEYLQVKFVPGVVQAVENNGTKVKILSLPIYGDITVNLATKGAAAVVSGSTAGVMTFICMEGATVYKFCKGDITDDIFIRDTLKNIGVGVAVGTAVLVTVALGATPEGWVVLGVAVGVSIVADLVFEKIMTEFYDTPQITMDDITAVLPTDMQRRTSSLDWSDYGYKIQNGSLFNHQGVDTVVDPTIHIEQGAFPEYKNRKSVIDN